MKNRYYNKDTKTQAVFKGENPPSNLIKDIDERVKNFFEPTPEGYIKKYDENNLPFNELIPKKTITELLKEVKEKKIAEFKIIYLEAANKDFIYKSNSYKGGESSASAIAGAINLAQALSESNCKIIDSNDEPHELTFESAAILSASIAKEWRDTFYKYKALKVKINTSVNQIELKLIVWAE
ncbi:MAG: hypothetical protein HRT41_02310 [Campylobacteraceae bacterium]|nr:hypothetical protein [Campylobacteraceae bacterium]